jgi:HlyD family secretion protein
MAILLAMVGIAYAVWRVASARGDVRVRFQTASIDRGHVAAKVTTTGALSALVTVDVGSQVAGRVDALLVDFASGVRKGQVIATIDPSLFLAAAEQARANHAAAVAALDRAHATVTNAERQVARSRMLLDANILARQDLDVSASALGVARADVAAAAAGVAQSAAALRKAELDLRHCTIVSPIDGVVISRNVAVGQNVAASVQTPTLFTLAPGLTRMQVDTDVPEADVGKIRPGTQVTFAVDAYPWRTFRGAVRQVRDDARTIRNVVTYEAIVDVDNSDHALKPGMTARVSFVHAEKDGVVRAPNAALSFRPDTAALREMGVTKVPPSSGDERVLWVLRAGRAVPVPVRVGLSDGAMTEVVAGGVIEGEDAIVDVAGGAEKEP